MSRLGKYQLVARIAKGGMAEIFLARQRGMVGFARLVVIKRILPHLAEEVEFVRMFMEEARLAALISHPNVVQIFDVGQHEGSYYMAMEYINGLSLGVIARRARELSEPLPCEMAGEIVAQACDGLHAAHELSDEAGQPLNPVHRDISPHNLMISRDGLVKLVDFGIAKAKDSTIKTRTGKLKGKYPYMSPEQCRGDPLDRRTDIFSLGIVLHELLTGVRLFQRSTELMILKAITEEPIPDPRELQPGLPAPVVEVILRALQRVPDDRYATAAEMGRAVRAAIPAGGPAPRERLAEQVQERYGDILAARGEALERVLALRPSDDPPPIVEGFEESSHRSTSAPTTGARTPRTTMPVTPLARRGRFVRRAVAVAVVVVALAAGAGLVVRHLRQAHRPPGPALHFGFPPSFPAKVGQRELRSFLRYLEGKLQRKVELVVPPSYHSLRQMLLSGELALANLPALQLVLARHEAPALEVVATQTYETARRYVSYIVVRSDAPISSIEQLRGVRFCYVDPESTSGYLLPRHYLRQHGLNPDGLFKATRYSGNHLRVLKDIIAGRCDAGAVYSGALLSAQSLGVPSSRLRMLAVTGQIPYDVICASPSLSRALLDRLRAALLGMDLKRDLGRKIIGPTFRIDGFVQPRLDEFEAIEQAAREEGLIRAAPASRPVK